MLNYEIKKIIENACSYLYKEEFNLIKNKTHERTISGEIFCHIRKIFQDKGWDVDLEYNREGDSTDPKQDDIGRMFPDIAVHTRGSVNGPNLFALEIKGYWNKANRSIDEDKLRRLREKYKYKYLYQLELGPNNWVLKEVDPIDSKEYLRSH